MQKFRFEDYAYMLENETPFIRFLERAGQKEHIREREFNQIQEIINYVCPIFQQQEGLHDMISCCCLYVFLMGIIKGKRVERKKKE